MTDLIIYISLSLAAAVLMTVAWLLFHGGEGSIFSIWLRHLERQAAAAREYELALKREDMTLVERVICLAGAQRGDKEKERR